MSEAGERMRARPEGRVAERSRAADSPAHRNALWPREAASKVRVHFANDPDRSMPMSTLRVLVTAAPSESAASPWARFDASGACTATGRNPPADWPDAHRIELVIAASEARLVALALPPLPPQRVAAAAAFALEDRIAGPLDEQWLAVSRQQHDGRVVVAVVARTLMSALREQMISGPL